MKHGISPTTESRKSKADAARSKLVHLSKYNVKIPEKTDEFGKTTPEQIMVQTKGTTYRSLERARRKDQPATYYKERRLMNG